jgi:cobalt/nickel-transporting P-type ATPase D
VLDHRRVHAVGQKPRRRGVRRHPERVRGTAAEGHPRCVADRGRPHGRIGCRSLSTKAKTQLFVEKIEQRYSVGMVVATLALIAIPLLLGVPLQPVLLRAMTFMIVASPCAVVLATMPPLLSAIANAGRHGVLVKSAVVAEHLADTSVVALDKIGTLTCGIPRPTTIESLDPNVNGRRLLQLAAAAEQSSEHPLGRAIVDEARMRGIAIPPAEDFRALPGRGVRATVGRDFVEICSPHSYPGPPLPQLASILEAGDTAAIVLVDGVAVGVLGLADQVRCDAARAVASLTALTSAPPVLLTGDNARAARRVARHAGITDVRAALLPEQKVEAVRGLQAGGHRGLVIGDGVNDAAAMAAASASVAMGAGADLTLQTADGVTVRDELHTIPTIIGLARQARRVWPATLPSRPASSPFWWCGICSGSCRSRWVWRVTRDPPSSWRSTACAC